MQTRLKYRCIKLKLQSDMRTGACWFAGNKYKNKNIKLNIGGQTNKQTFGRPYSNSMLKSSFMFMPFTRHKQWNTYSLLTISQSLMLLLHHYM